MPTAFQPARFCRSLKFCNTLRLPSAIWSSDSGQFAVSIEISPWCDQGFAWPVEIRNRIRHHLLSVPTRNRFSQSSVMIRRRSTGLSITELFKLRVVQRIRIVKLAGIKIREEYGQKQETGNPTGVVVDIDH